MQNIIKKTVFRVRYDGTKKVIMNYVLDSAISFLMTKLFFKSWTDEYDSIGCSRIAENDHSVTYVNNAGYIINLRMV